MEAYIRGIGSISPQRTFDNEWFMEEVRKFDTARMSCVEPDYKEYIKPIKLRRMSRVLKMGVTAAGICLRDAEVEVPDAIITGTGLGIMEETEKFLISLLDNNETLLTPTSFIQSTHNTVGAHIAVMLKCTAYNMTFVHGFTSFENALTDALMKLEEVNGTDILVGGIDEMTDRHFKITGSVDFWKKGNIDTLQIAGSESPGTLAGEGAAFFILNKKDSTDNYARIRGVRSFYRPDSLADTKDQITDFLESHQLNAGDIDLVLLGINGDYSTDKVYYEVADELFDVDQTGMYKHLCGEYYTASSFALWLAAKALKHGTAPGIVWLNNTAGAKKELKNILIYNQYKNINHSLMLVSSC